VVVVVVVDNVGRFGRGGEKLVEFRVAFDCYHDGLQRVDEGSRIGDNEGR